MKNANQAIVYLTNETSFKAYNKHPFDDAAPIGVYAVNNIKKDIKMSYKALLKAHLNDYMTLFNNVHLNINNAIFDTKRTTEEQLKAYSLNNENNNYLEALYFHFGRYLLISSSRTKGVPPNLYKEYGTKK